MPSLRRSLISYFLVLLAVGLGAVALIADRVIDGALAEKETAALELVDVGTADKLHQERDQFDRELLAHAKAVARTARTAVTDFSIEVERANNRQRIQQLVGLLGTELTALPLPTNPAWFQTANWQLMNQSPNVSRRGSWTVGPVWNALNQHNSSNLNFNQSLLRHLEDDDKTSDLIQINSSRGILWKSSNTPSLGLPFDREKWDADGDDWRYDDVELPQGQVRRVTFKTSPNGLSGMMRWGQPREPQMGPPPPRGQPQPPREPARPDARDTIPNNYIHIARTTADRDADLAAIRDEAVAKRGEISRATASSQRWVRLALLVTCGVAFLGLVVGGFGVIRVGLHPLKKLSDAVSRVNEKDFRLPVTKEELTEELAPIHDRLVHSLDALKAAFEREKDAVADISHELRTPVAGLLATIDVSLRKPRTAEQYKATLEDCRGITKQLAGLVERVMTLAYLDAGQTQIQTAPTDVAELARSCAAIIRPLAESHGLTLTTELADTAELTTDSDKLREVMMNLLHNAVEYNKPGGTIELRVRRGSNRGPVIVEVADSGIGISAEVQARIFERFYRADPSRTATGVHAGLGLAIVKEYVSRLGGQIGLHSTPNAGSTFRVTLPG